MYDIAVGIIGILAARHNDEILVAGVDDLNVMNGELIVERDRDDSLHGAVLKDLSDFDVCDFHSFSPCSI